jgi:hypothetical protein
VLKCDWRNTIVSGRINQLKSRGSLAFVPGRAGSPAWATSARGPHRVVGSRVRTLRASGPSGAGRAEGNELPFS